MAKRKFAAPVEEWLQYFTHFFLFLLFFSPRFHVTRPPTAISRDRINSRRELSKVRKACLGSQLQGESAKGVAFCFSLLLSPAMATSFLGAPLSLPSRCLPLSLFRPFLSLGNVSRSMQLAQLLVGDREKSAQATGSRG